MAGTQDLKSLNTSNASTKVLTFEVRDPIKRSPPGKQMTIVNCKLLHASGLYTLGEAVLFGNETTRNKTADTILAKFTHGTQYEFSNISATRKNPQFHHCPHNYIINLGAKTFKVEKKKERVPEMPKVLEPGLSVSEITKLTVSQMVDAFAYCAEVKSQKDIESKSGKKNSVVEVILRDDKGTEIPCNL